MFDIDIDDSFVQIMPTSEQQRLAAESLYRDANSLLYADNKPTEDAIDRVVGKINQEYVYFQALGRLSD